MNVVGITRVFNEDDIIESFVRHHAHFFRHHIFIDNGSSDRTISILLNLKKEGFNISLFQNKSVLFQEIEINTEFYKVARKMSPDWIMYLDADEFIDVHDEVEDFFSILRRTKKNTECVLFEMINYQNTFEDNQSEMITPVRIGYRLPHSADVWKLAIRGQIETNVVVDAGNHGAYVDNRVATDAKCKKIKLAHFNRRSVWQELTKIIIGYAKVTSTGHEAKIRNWSAHYRPFFERLKSRPWEILHNDYILSKDNINGQYIYDPMNYLGGVLRYTVATDYAMKSVTSILGYLERLAEEHGKIVDQMRESNNMKQNFPIEHIF